MNREEFTSPLSAADVRITDGFWFEKMELVRTKMIPYQWRVLNDCQPGAVPSHSIENFRIAAGRAEGPFRGFVFQDSDLAKWLEAVGYVLAGHKDDRLEALADSAIELIEAAQQPDGYLDTYYIINGLEKAWTNLADHHELYCAGHMIEAAVAYYQGTGKRKLLDVAIRLADCVDRRFGPEEGKLRGYPGHEILEMALIRLYHVTGEERYLRLAVFFLEERGREPNYFREERLKYDNNDPWKNSLFGYGYYQADRPVREQTVAEGHAVRAMYLYCGMAAAAKETGDEALQEVCRRLWEDVTRRQMYITGAVGASPYGESFTFDYDLPNDTVYGETCASIGLVFWGRRMLEMDLDSVYGDEMERALYNACLSGMSVEGTGFFYVNPLEVWPEASKKDEGKRHVKTLRRSWFPCACCPPNLARLISSIGRYAFTEGEDGFAFHLYLSGEMTGRKSGLRMRMESGLPWMGDVSLRILGAPEEERKLFFRIPGWCGGSWRIELNGQDVTETAFPAKGYAVLSKVLAPGDELSLHFGMPVLIQQANPRVRENIGKAAVSRGPVVYCLEEADMGRDLHRIVLPADAVFEEVPGRQGRDSVDLETTGLRLADADWEDCLYRGNIQETYEPVRLHLVPYHLWNNRGEGEMLVWIHRR